MTDDFAADDPAGEPTSTALCWVVLLLVAVAVPVVGAVVPFPAVRGVFVIPDLLVVPGFVILRVILRPVEWALTLVASVGVSVAVLLADALVLNLLRIRLSPGSISVAVLAVTAVATFAAIYRNSPVRLPWLSDRASRHGLRRPLTVGACAALCILVVIISAIALPVPKAPATTTFSFGEAAAKLPAAVAVQAQQQVNLPVAIMMSRRSSARFILSATVDGRRSEDREIDVGSSGSWRGVSSVVAPAGPGLHRVVLQLTRTTGAPFVRTLVIYLQDRSP